MAGGSGPRLLVAVERDVVRVRVGDWYTYCCDEDLRQVEDAEDAESVNELSDEGALVPLGVWPTRDAAVAALRSRERAPSEGRA